MLFLLDVSLMFRIRCYHRKVQRWIVIALVLLCFVFSAVNLQFYLESRVVTKLVNQTLTYVNKSDQQKSYFDMSLNELMEVVVVSQAEGQPSSRLLYFKRCFSKLGPKLS